jgi:hypothetical protein
MNSVAMVRNFNGRTATFLRFHDADHVVVDDQGTERAISKKAWAALPPWGGDGARA